MFFKSAVFTVAVFACCLTLTGCQSGESIWAKPGYEAQPAGSGASRTYTPTETVSPYQSQPSYGGSGTASSGGSGGR